MIQPIKNMMLFYFMFFLFVSMFTSDIEAQWVTSGSNIYYNTGYVGIGTSSPASRLTLNGYGWNGGLELDNSYYSGYYSRICDATDGMLFKNYGPGIVLFSFRNSSDTHLLDISSNGNINVGAPPAGGSYLLNVGGNIRANEVVVNTSGADYVFNNTYKLMSLNKLSSYIKQNKHLPGLPSAKEMQTKGEKVSETQTKLLAKVEELTLYIIKQQKEIDELKSEKSNRKK